VDPIPLGMESYIRLVRPYMDSGSLYWPTPWGDVVLSMLHGTWMTSDRTEVTTVPLVLAGSVRCVYSCESRSARLGSTSPHSSWGWGWWRGHEFLVRHAAKVEGRGHG
jgi:hypothetical protein